ncbi:hypothetical protein TNIN_478801 [Trichonephila inaurata madagascariensis]|uniref:Uncharacterized protein n=1 Tax=Trichonephila inaurata madagascariensis TaxID=2747483 RepID=A0A8X6WV14_9ARAC|nr:hypothetical protein TNIN_478801 [Trichonephila inaurata madagascariensis]
MKSSLINNSSLSSVCTSTKLFSTSFVCQCLIPEGFLCGINLPLLKHPCKISFQQAFVAVTLHCSVQRSTTPN